jgi:hypothetical protein
MRIACAGSLVLWLALVSCSGPGGGNDEVATVSDQASAERFAWSVESSVRRAAPDSDTVVWNGTVVNGLVSGTATVTGSYTHTYDAMSGMATDCYSNVTIVFSNYADSGYYPHLSGTLTLGGTCTTYYGWSTTYSGSWDAVGDPLILGGSYTSQASIVLQWLRAGLDWTATVEANGQRWDMAY